MSVKDIESGEEITAYYGDDYWEAVRQKMKQDMIATKMQKLIETTDINNTQSNDIVWA